MMKRITGIIILLLTLAKIAGAQEPLSLKQLADKFYDRYEYAKSLNLYLQLADKNKPGIQIIERVADCYRNMNQYTDAEPWYERAVADPKANKIDHFYYAEILLRTGKFEQAKLQYRLYFTNGDAELIPKVSGCDSAAKWMGEQPRYKVDNVKSMNSQYSDWGASYDGKTGLLFTSDRVVDDGMDNRTGNNWFKMYRLDIKSNEVKPVFISSAMSDDFNGNYHLGPMALNKTGDTAYITVTTEIPKKKIGADKKDWKSNQKLFSRRLQLVRAVKKNDQWLIIDAFPYNNIQKYSVGSAALSNNGRVIYFSSDMPGGEGKTDIWYCEKQADGTWGKPVNCGKNINTKEEDDFPYISGDGTLYYASKGLPGMGGYDIYAAKGEKGNWSIPQNLKYPINTTADDFYFVTRDGLSGYLSSNRYGGAGNDDIYVFGEAIATVIPQKPVVHTKPILNMPAQPNTGTQGFVFEPIYYDLDKSNIRPDAAITLDKLADFLKQYPELKIEVSAYTDSRAAGDYNFKLSERRAKAAVDYLTAKGIDANRLVAKWYGKTNLVNNCPDGVNCTEAEHQLNRRTEFKVTGAGK